MDKVRKPFQGVWNIIRFNWHFYVLVFAFLLLLHLGAKYVNESVTFYFRLIGTLIFLQTTISLLVSYYIYDLSGFYDLNWINEFELEQNYKIININAGFDETSHLLQAKFKNSELKVFDFYNPKLHTEISIERARNAYLPYSNTIQIETNNLKLVDNSIDKIFVIFAAHEIRNEQERIAFFIEMKRILKPTGEIIIIEHLRDFPNFLVYSIGFLHFYSKSAWLKTIELVALNLTKETKITAFISIFKITKNGISS